MDFREHYHLEIASLIGEANYLADILSGEKNYSWGSYGFPLQNADEHKLTCIWLLVEHASALQSRRTMCPVLADKMDGVARVIYEKISRDEGVVDPISRQNAQIPWMNALLGIVGAIADHGNLDKVCRYWMPFMSLLSQSVQAVKQTVLEKFSEYMDTLSGLNNPGYESMPHTLILAVEVANNAVLVNDAQLEEVTVRWVKKALEGDQPDWVFEMLQRYDLLERRASDSVPENTYMVRSEQMRQALIDVAARDPAFFKSALQSRTVSDKFKFLLKPQR